MTITEIRLCNPRIVKIYMVKFNVSILNRLKIIVFFVNKKQMHKHNVIFNKALTKIVTILTKCFFPYLNPTSYLNIKSRQVGFSGFL